MKYTTSVTIVLFLLLAPALHAAPNIGSVWVQGLTDTTITIGYSINTQWRLTGHYKIKYSLSGSSDYLDNITSDSTNAIENLKPGTRYLIFVEAQTKRIAGISPDMYRQVGFLEVSTKQKNFATCPPMSWDGGTILPTFDGANCFVADLSKLGPTFVYQNKYYVRPRRGPSCPASECTCPAGTMDGDRCFIREKPPFGFVFSNNFYARATVDGKCPLGGTFDSRNCFLGSAPFGTTAFEAQGKFYTTRLPFCPAGRFDGANCWIGDGPGVRRAFVYNGAFYFE
ncbi:MAG TPA: hypothetical protein VM733_22645 [Thermoanaerobaculia bacterium]|nr:hypothetical protein [Thermoanaerobaculia bacterium]